MIVNATLPYPPSVNHYWVMGKGRVYISPKGRAYCRQVAGILNDAPLLSGPVSVTIMAYPPDKRKRDLDNLLKCLLDAVTKSKGLWEDDSQIKKLTIEWGAMVNGGLIELTIGYS